MRHEHACAAWVSVGCSPTGLSLHKTFCAVSLHLRPAEVFLDLHRVHRLLEEVRLSLQSRHLSGHCSSFLDSRRCTRNSAHSAVGRAVLNKCLYSARVIGPRGLGVDTNDT